MAFVDALGTGAFLTGSALFFTGDLGLSPQQVGLGLSVASAVGFLCSVPIGRLSDRVGARAALVALALWRGMSFLAYPFVDGFAAFLVVACLVGVAEWATPPILQSLVGSLVADRSRVRTMSAMMMLRNVGFTLAAGASAAAVAVGGGPVYRVLVFANAASFLVSAVILVRVRAARRDPEAPERDPAAAGPTWPGGRFLALTVLNGLLFLHAVVLTVGLPLWVVGDISAPGSLVGVIVVTNTLLAVGLQMRLSRGVDGTRSGASRQRRAGLALAVCCALVAVAGATPPAVTIALALAATAALTAGEVYQSVGAWALSYALSPEASRGYHLSVYNLGSTGAMILGPWLVTAVVMPAGPAGWIGLGVAFAATGALVPVVTRRLPSTAVPR